MDEWSSAAALPLRKYGHFSCEKMKCPHRLMFYGKSFTLKDQFLAQATVSVL